MMREYRVGDATKFLGDLIREGIKPAGVVTSPPYNKQFPKSLGKNSRWKNSTLQNEGYSHYDDNMEESDYIAWQRKFLAVALEAVGEDGVVFYNIGRKIKNLREDLRYNIIEGFPLRQTIIWNRGSSFNIGGKKPATLPHIYELIYVLAGDKWRLPKKYVKIFRSWGDVWNILPEMNNPHPAPFPEQLATRMVMCVDGLVSDPFAGSGTVGAAAESLRLPYILNDISPDYKEMFEKRSLTNASLSKLF